uniref:J domain-containing protein n=1 Tax=Prasinoderma coloniale TaxID=156133 RepID=A0A6U0NAU2_9VIRI
MARHNAGAERALEACAVAAAEAEGDAAPLLRHADALMLLARYAEARQKYQEAMQAQQSHEAHRGMQNAERMQKQKDRKDYYKVLEIARTASAADIKKAYRRMATRWHPDKNQDNLEEASRHMQEINEAHEVLSDADVRARYDRGEDVSNRAQEESQRQAQTQQQHMFRQHFGGFGGGGGPRRGPGGGQQFFFHMG